ncbi:hypothetical protein [Streptomyces sp. NPDC001948]
MRSPREYRKSQGWALCMDGAAVASATRSVTTVSVSVWADI